MAASKFKIEGPYPPTIIRSFVDGKRYAISGVWVEIPEDMTYEEVYAGWVNTCKRAKENKVQYPISRKRFFKVLSSKRDKNYVVKLDRGFYSCTCVGYDFRRDCTHIKQVKEYIKNENG